MEDHGGTQQRTSQQQIAMAWPILWAMALLGNPGTTVQTGVCQLHLTWHMAQTCGMCQ